MENKINKIGTVRHNPKVVAQVIEYCESEGSYTQNIGKFYDLAALEELRRIEVKIKNKIKKQNKTNE